MLTSANFLVLLLLFLKAIMDVNKLRKFEVSNIFQQKVVASSILEGSGRKKHVSGENAVSRRQRKWKYRNSWHI